MSLRTSFIAAGMIAAFLCLPGRSFAGSPSPLSGDILGEVKNVAGVAQMGATVYLYNRFDELVGQGLTNEQGRFVFDSLIPGLYSIRVLLASFAPAERSNIAVQASAESRLNINLNSVLSTVAIGSPGTKSGTLMTDDWKWVLRSSQASRPVMRYLPDTSTSNSAQTIASAFSNTSGVLQLSAGDGESFTLGAQEDLGTAFAVATTLAGTGRVQFSGNIGYSGASALPGAGIRTSYSRVLTNGSSPEVVVSVHQMYLGAARPGTGMALGMDNLSALRTASAAFMDKFELSDNLRFDYGFDFESVSYLDHLNYASPFARATYDAGPNGRLRVGFSAGAHPAEMLGRDQEKAGNFDQDLAALAMLPRISLSNGDLAVERTRDAEIGYERVAGSRTYSVGAYSETVSNAAFMLSGPAGFVGAADILPDLGSHSDIFNVGGYHRNGYTAGMTQQVGDHLELAVSAGRTGALTARGPDPSYSDGSDLRAGIHQVDRAWVTMRMTTTVPKAGTRITSDYGWTDFNALMPAHAFMTLKSNQDVGWNVYIRQPLPYFSGMPWHLEATAELRNILAQGYLPLGAPGSHTILTNAPRAVRGGLSFIF